MEQLWFINFTARENVMNKKSFLKIVITGEGLTAAQTTRLLKWDHQRVYPLLEDGKGFPMKNLKHLMKSLHLTPQKVADYVAEWLL